MASQKKGTELQVRGSDPVGRALAQYDVARYNVLTPVTVIDRLPEMTRLSVRIVQADIENDTYHSKLFMGQTERAPSKLLLDKIAAAAGLSWDPLNCGRIDDRSDPNVVEWKMAGRLLDFDGLARTIIRSKRVDLNDDSSQVRGWTVKQIQASRGHLMELAESKAANRVIRAALSVRQKYTRDELARPFVIPRLVPEFDLSDPIVRAAIVAHRLGAERQLYQPAPAAIIDLPEGPQAEPPALPPEDEPDDDGRDVGTADGFPDEPTTEKAPSERCECAVCPTGVGEACGVDLTDQQAVVAFTRKHFGKPLCALCCSASQQYDKEAHRV